MKKWFKKTVATILTVTMTMTIVTPAFAAQEDTTINAVLTQALATATEQDKASINEVLTYLNEGGIFSVGELVAINLNSSEISANGMNKYVYVIDFGEFSEEFIFSEISDEVISYSIRQGEKYNTISEYSDGRFLLNGHGIDIMNIDAETGNTYTRNTATNMVTTSIAASGETIVTPYAADIDYTDTCPYQAARDYTYFAYESEQPNLFLYEVFSTLTVSGFITILKNAYQPLKALSNIWSVGSKIYDFVFDTAPDTEGLSYYEENYFHKTCDYLSAGHIDALGYSVTKMVTTWYALPYYEGDCHITTIYRTYQHW